MNNDRRIPGFFPKPLSVKPKKTLREWMRESAREFIDDIGRVAEYKENAAKRRWLDMAHPMPKKGAQ